MTLDTKWTQRVCAEIYRNFCVVLLIVKSGIIESIIGGGVSHMFSRPTNERYHPAGSHFFDTGRDPDSLHLL